MDTLKKLIAENEQLFDELEFWKSVAVELYTPEDAYEEFLRDAATYSLDKAKWLESAASGWGKKYAYWLNFDSSAYKFEEETGREEPCGSELLQREKEKKEKLAIAELVKELMLPLSEQRNIRCDTP